MTCLYGISNCDTVKRARQRLAQAGIDYRFHDFRKDGLDAATLEHWLTRLGRDELINRRGTTWRRLSPEQQRIGSDADAVALMLAQPGLIRRPVIEHAGTLRVGFARADEAAILDWLSATAGD